MNFVPLTSREDSEAAFRMFRTGMIVGCQGFHRKLGYQGGSEPHTVYWNASEKLWSVFDAKVAHGRYWCAFGTQHPEVKPMLDITVECNPPLEKINRRCAGAFLRAGRQIFVAHSGKIGGGRKGIGKSTFVDFYPEENRQAVQWPDKHETEMLVIAAVDDTQLPSLIAAFVRKVEQFKNAIANGVKPPVSTEAEPSFTPEFAGKRRAYTVSTRIQSSCSHGFVVNELKAELEKRGFKGIGKDRPRDLYVEPTKGRVEFLFEAKTDLATDSIYKGIGQLAYHSAKDAKDTKRVFVLPGSPKPETQAVLAQLGIRVLRYVLDGNKPVFKNLDEVVR